MTQNTSVLVTVVEEKTNKQTAEVFLQGDGLLEHSSEAKPSSLFLEAARLEKVLNIRWSRCSDALFWSLQLLPGFRGAT